MGATNFPFRRAFPSARAVTMAGAAIEINDSYPEPKRVLNQKLSDASSSPVASLDSAFKSAARPVTAHWYHVWTLLVWDCSYRDSF
ncbi:hypothetical protein EVAR_61974_1 [Eumeta japonica]|uniref:Uncharacterized protein n=1 Tax=Eumeta variegata TaxID=151549 RepID=A0A4C1ZSB7_EUMVA|nr:hypothetical protein EVAR_61974_1 [Eumeta japonica]